MNHNVKNGKNDLNVFKGNYLLQSYQNSCQHNAVNALDKCSEKHFKKAFLKTWENRLFEHVKILWNALGAHLLMATAFLVSFTHA